MSSHALEGGIRRYASEPVLDDADEMRPTPRAALHRVDGDDALSLGEGLFACAWIGGAIFVCTLGFWF